jgi:hypothetical protein
MNAIVTDNPTAPEGYKTEHYNEYFVHYNPNDISESDIEHIIADAASGDDKELKKIAVFDTPSTRK